VEYTDPMKIEITQEKIIDILMHAATREDIASTRKDLKDDIQSVKNDIQLVKADISALRKDNSKITWFIILSMLLPIFLHVFHF